MLKIPITKTAPLFLAVLLMPSASIAECTIVTECLKQEVKELRQQNKKQQEQIEKLQAAVDKAQATANECVV